MAEQDEAIRTPAGALEELLAGNRRFVDGRRIHPHQDAERRAALAFAQRPFAIVFGCSDSRLAAEIIFDRGLGDLFVARTAGHIIGSEVRASIEYGVTVLEAPLVVVLGHDSCGAIAAASDVLDGQPLPDPGLSVIVDRIAPSIRYANALGLTDRDDISEVHIRRTIDLLNEPGTAIAQAVAAGRCAVVGLAYRLADGLVTVIPPIPASDVVLGADQDHVPG